MGINAYLKNQVENYSKIDSSVKDLKVQKYPGLISPRLGRKIEITCSRHHETNKLILNNKYYNKYSRELGTQHGS